MEYDLFMENFSLGTFIEESYYRVYSADEGEQFLESVITEASESKGNIFTRIWNMIKKLFGWIRDKIKKLIRWVQHLFGFGDDKKKKKKKKKKKTADQIASEVTSAKPASAAAPTPAPTPADSGSAPASTKAASTKAVVVDHDTSSGQPEEVKMPLPHRDLVAAFHNDRDTLVFKAKNLQSKAARMNPREKSDANNTANHIGSDGDDIGTHAIITLNIIVNHADFMDQLKAIVGKVSSEEGWTGEDAKRNEFWSKFWNEAGTLRNKHLEMYRNSVSDNEGIEVSLDQIMKFQAQVDVVIKSISEFDISTKSGETFSKPMTDGINSISSIVAKLQKGINGLLVATSGCYLIDLDYASTVESLDELENFVSESLDAGIPGRYIATNVASLVKPNTVFATVRGDLNHGQLIFQSGANKQEDIKFAVNEYGRYMSNIEVRITKAIKENTPDALKFFPNALRWHSQKGVTLITEHSEPIKGNAYSKEQLKAVMNGYMKALGSAKIDYHHGITPPGNLAKSPDMGVKITASGTFPVIRNPLYAAKAGGTNDYT